MGERTRRAAQRAGLAAVAAALGLPAAAGAVAPGGVADPSRPLVDRRDASGPGAGATPARVREARAGLRQRFGRQLVLDVDPDTGATRVVQRLDGALTAPASGDRAQVARAWVRENRAVLGLDAPDVDGLSVAEEETTGRSGLTSVRFAQRFRGIEVFDGGLEVTLDRGGRVLAAVGAPVAAPEVDSIDPGLDAEAARRALEAGVGATETVRAPELTLFGLPGGTRLAWRLLERRSSTVTIAAVVDATSGGLLLRQNLTKDAAPSAISPNFPGAENDPRTGAANALREVDLERAGYLPAGATTLSGPYARAFSDVDDDDFADPGEEVAPGADGFRFGFVPTTAACPASPEAPTPKCTWDPAVPDSWQTNRKQNAVQAFALVNRFRDHLERPEIGFGPDGFAGGDRVIVHARDGAELQDSRHRNNANMTTLPEGFSPRMQMYLFRGPNFRAVDSGDDAAIVYHEYTHGLSGRLVTHGDGTSALSSVHAGALGEAWSDFYALDLLHRDGLEVDDLDTPGDVQLGAYVNAVPRTLRSQGADCPVAVTDPACPGRGSAGPGGYTFGDLGKVANRTQVHADGEIWLETLWDLRRALVGATQSEAAGSDAVERLVTDGMRLGPPEPSFIDARNAILTADTAAGGTYRDLIWQVFAARGMGFFADADDANDATPTEDFSPPPAPGAPTGTVTGRITDAAGQLGLAGARVSFTLPGGEAPSATTDADGRYTLVTATGATPRRTPLRLTGPPGYDPATASVTLRQGESVTLDRALRRDWASLAGGAALAQNLGGFCGPRHAIDEIAGSGWSADRGSFGPRPSITVVLPTAIDVTAIGIDPAPTCGDGPNAALRDFSVEAVRDTGAVPMLAGGFAIADQGRLNLRAPTGNARGVTRLRLTLEASQGPGTYVDLAALSVYGTRSDGAPRGTLRATPATVAPDQSLTLDASSFTDPDSLIATYAWDLDGDGGVDRVTPGPTTTHAYAAPGDREPRVTVTDVGGAEGRAVAAVRVVDPASPAPPEVSPSPAPPSGAEAPPATEQPPAVKKSPAVTEPPSVAPGPSLQIAKRVRRAASVSVRCAPRCSVRATGTVSAATARRLGRPRRTVLAITRRATGASKVTLPLGRATLGAARRRGVRALSVALTVRATDALGRTSTRRATVRVTL